MADDAPFAEDGAAPAKASRSWPLTILRWVGLSLLGLVLLCALFLVGLNSDAGRRFVVTQIEKYEFENGMKIGIGRLDGSLYGRMIIRDFTLSDPKGVFLASPEVKVDWRPIRYLANHVDVRSATAATMTMRKLPEFKVVPDTGEPLLPDLDIDVGLVRVDRFVFEPPVAGERQVARLNGKIAIADRRAQVTANAETIAGGGGQGDALKLVLDAVPEAKRLQGNADRKARRARRLESVERQSDREPRRGAARARRADRARRHFCGKGDGAGVAVVNRSDDRDIGHRNRDRPDRTASGAQGRDRRTPVFRCRAARDQRRHRSWHQPLRGATACGQYPSPKCDRARGARQRAARDGDARRRLRIADGGISGECQQSRVQ